MGGSNPIGSSGVSGFSKIETDLVGSGQKAGSKPSFRRGDDPPSRVQNAARFVDSGPTPSVVGLNASAKLLSQKIQDLRQERVAAQNKGVEPYKMLKMSIEAFSKLSEKLSDMLNSLLQNSVELAGKLADWQSLVDDFKDAVKETKRYIEDLFTSLERKAEDILTEDDDKLGMDKLLRRGDRLMDDFQTTCSRFIDDSRGKVDKLTR